MKINEELAELLWEKFKDRTGIDDENVRKAFLDLIFMAVNETNRQVRVCHTDLCRMVSYMMGRKGIPKLIKGINKDSSKSNAFITVMEYVYTRNDGEELFSKKVLKELGWGMTYGDFLLSCLDFFVCAGVLKKIRYARGKPGHKYIKTKHSCEFANITYNDYGFPLGFQCMFNWENGILIHGRYDKKKQSSEQ